jgi:hypothetical protein
MLKSIVSGGQTGVDRGALDAAIAAGIAHGGWCPCGRRAEDGRIPSRYGLVETQSGGYSVRTGWNVRDSDGTLILTRGGKPAGGTKLTMECARRYGRSCLTVVLDGTEEAGLVADWIETRKISVLNVAGPRESSRPGIGRDARRFVEQVICCDRSRTPAGS